MKFADGFPGTSTENYWTYIMRFVDLMQFKSTPSGT